MKFPVLFQVSPQSDPLYPFHLGKVYREFWRGGAGKCKGTPRPARAPLPSPHIRAPSPIAPTEFQKFETLRLFIVLCRFATKDKLFYRQLTFEPPYEKGFALLACLLVPCVSIQLTLSQSAGFVW